MNRIANPYNIHALYEDQLWDEQRYCPMYCSTRNLPATQLKLPLSTSGSTYEAHLINPETSFSQDVSSKMNRSCTTAGVFYSYDGSQLSTELDEGMYQLRVKVGSTYYWGHPYCAKTAFRTSSNPVAVFMPSLTSGGYQIAFSTATADVDGYAYSWEYKQGGAWTAFSTGSSGTLTQDDLGAVGTISASFRLNIYIANTYVYREYAASFDVADPAGTFAGEIVAWGGEGLNRFLRLNWRNSTDLQSLGIQYADYIQQFYFEADEAFPTPIIQDNFIQNGEAGLFLESAIVAEQINLDLYPIPPHAAAVLSSVRIHDNVYIQAMWDQEQETLTNFQFVPQTVDQSLCQRGRISYERNRSYVGGCQEDYTTQSCS